MSYRTIETPLEIIDEILFDIQEGKYNETVLSARAWSPFDGAYWEWVTAFIHKGRILWAKDPKDYHHWYRWQPVDNDRMILAQLTNHKFFGMDEIQDGLPTGLIRFHMMAAEKLGLSWFSYPCKDCGKRLVDWEDANMEYDEPLCQDCLATKEAEEWSAEVKRLLGVDTAVQRYFEMAKDTEDRMTVDTIDRDLIEEINNHVYIKSNGSLPPWPDDEGDLWIHHEYEPAFTAKQCLMCGEHQPRGYFCESRRVFVCEACVILEYEPNPNQLELPLDHHYWFDEYGYLKQEIPEKAVEECSGPGEAGPAVSLWVKRLNFNVDRHKAISYLREFGAWTFDELRGMTEKELAEIVFWIACGDIRENGEWFGMVH